MRPYKLRASAPIFKLVPHEKISQPAYENAL